MSLMSQIALTVTPYRLEIDHKESPETTLYWNGNSIGVSFLSAAFAVSAASSSNALRSSSERASIDELQDVSFLL